MTHYRQSRNSGAKIFRYHFAPGIYDYACSVSGNVRSCEFREIFDYGVDTTVNPVDKIKHSYGWVSWRYYVNSTKGKPRCRRQSGCWRIHRHPTS